MRDFACRCCEGTGVHKDLSWNSPTYRETFPCESCGGGGLSVAIDDPLCDNYIYEL